VSDLSNLSRSQLLPRMVQDHYHTGTCSATDFGKRYGKNLDPQSFDASEHQWHLAKNKNWGPWNCCGGEASSPGCTRRAAALPKTTGAIASPLERAGNTSGVGGSLKFLNNEGNIALVVDEDAKAWILENGRIAKKKTEGKSWVWL
jgi:hypothetical protein